MQNKKIISRAVIIISLLSLLLFSCGKKEDEDREFESYKKESIEETQDNIELLSRENIKYLYDRYAITREGVVYSLYPRSYNSDELLMREISSNILNFDQSLENPSSVVFFDKEAIEHKTSISPFEDFKIYEYSSSEIGYSSLPKDERNFMFLENGYYISDGNLAKKDITVETRHEYLVAGNVSSAQSIDKNSVFYQTNGGDIFYYTNEKPLELKKDTPIEDKYTKDYEKDTSFEEKILEDINTFSLSSLAKDTNKNMIFYRTNDGYLYSIKYNEPNKPIYSGNLPSENIKNNEKIKLHDKKVQWFNASPRYLTFLDEDDDLYYMDYSLKPIHISNDFDLKTATIFEQRSKDTQDSCLHIMKMYNSGKLEHDKIIRHTKPDENAPKISKIVSGNIVIDTENNLYKVNVSSNDIKNISYERLNKKAEIIGYDTGYNVSGNRKEPPYSISQYKTSDEKLQVKFMGHQKTVPINITGKYAPMGRQLLIDTESNLYEIDLKSLGIKDYSEILNKTIHSVDKINIKKVAEKVRRADKVYDRYFIIDNNGRFFIKKDGKEELFINDDVKFLNVNQGMYSGGNADVIYQTKNGDVHRLAFTTDSNDEIKDVTNIKITPAKNQMISREGISFFINGTNISTIKNDSEVQFAISKEKMWSDVSIIDGKSENSFDDTKYIIALDENGIIHAYEWRFRDKNSALNEQDTINLE